MSAPRLKTVTLGCKVNQYETEYLREGLLGIGYVDAGSEEIADLCVVNTCTVTSAGDSKSRKTIRQLARRNPGTRIVVMGCYATRAPEEVARLPGVVEVLTDKRELPDLLGRFGVTDIPTGVTGLGQRHRAYVKVQDGCLLRCSFCIIPQVRPHMESRPATEIVSEVQRLVNNGYGEIVLTGIHLGHYGVDFNRGRPKSDWTRLSHLVRMIAKLPGDFRIRLSSIEATEVTQELIDVMGENPKRVCPHLHISMQSGSDSVLRRMGRRWGSRRYVDRCQLVQSLLDLPAITTDIIVGFPGETEEEFLDTCRVAGEVGFSKIHIFPFSARRGTAAAELPGQLPKSIKQERAGRLALLEGELRAHYYRRLQGQRLRVLVESPSTRNKNLLTGTSCRYAPVEVSADGTTIGRFHDIVAGEVLDNAILAAS
ncbi:MAG: tRNA (N(6)-L-threonylcarbamoyladenosine(37)-C(2))-methylthiotransferase MtaB [Planctomycetales bacterium]